MRLREKTFINHTSAHHVWSAEADKYAMGAAAAENAVIRRSQKDNHKWKLSRNLYVDIFGFRSLVAIAVYLGKFDIKETRCQMFEESDTGSFI